MVNTAYQAACDNDLQPIHGVGVCVVSKPGKITLYVLPI